MTGQTEQKWQEIKGVENVIIRGNEIMVLGIPENNDDENHNCDVMGCTSVMCVLYRGWLRAKEIGISTVEFVP